LVGLRSNRIESNRPDLNSIRTSPGTEEGDIVVIFLGGITPFIIRESKSVSGEFSLVGPAYVHDIMYGEAMGGGDTETFFLI
jgi:hypothetical protein